VPGWIIILSGPVSSGKTTLASMLATRFSMRVVKTRQLLTNSLAEKSSAGRIPLQNEGDRLDRVTEGRWVADELAKLVVESSPGTSFIVDSARIAAQVTAARKAFPAVVHVHLKAPLPTLTRRYDERRKRESGAPTYSKVRENVTERNIGELENIADIVIDTDRCTAEDVFIRATSRMGIFESRKGYVDIVIGGQYGSEGKGQIVDYLLDDYDVVVRVGGPNAGHSVAEGGITHIYRMLPSGSATHQAHYVLGPGMIVEPQALVKEIGECKLDVSQLTIDPQVMTLTQEDKTNEGSLVRDIGSTGSGTGAATARRILERGTGGAKLARDVPELKHYIGKATDVLSKELSEGKRILVEGTQGTGLSLYHGDYPYVTSRDTTVAGCLSEAGIAPTSVRRVIMVCRAYPIRVQNPKNGTSGPLSQEIDWRVVSKRSGIPLKELMKHERGSVTGRLRRVGEFDWKLLKESSFLNGPTDIALTFADYLSKKNASAFRFDQLDPSTIQFIEEVERVARTTVSLIATGYGERHVIDRRSW